MEATLTTAPPPCSRMGPITACVQSMVPLRLMSSTRSISASIMFCSVHLPMTPALFTNTRTGPSSFATELKAAVIDEALATSVTTASDPGMSAAISFSAISFESSRASFAPSAARARAEAAPIPLAAPVTTATLSWNRSGLISNVSIELDAGGAPDRLPPMAIGEQCFLEVLGRAAGDFKADFVQALGHFGHSQSIRDRLGVLGCNCRRRASAHEKAKRGLADEFRVAQFGERRDVRRER